MTLSLRHRLLAWMIPAVILVTLGGLLLARAAEQTVNHQQKALWAAQLARGRDHVARRQAELTQTAREYALWDEMVDFAAGRTAPSWGDDNLGDWLYQHFDVSFVLVLDREGRVVYARDPTGTFSAGDDASESPIERLALSSPTAPAVMPLGDSRIWLAAATIHPTLAPGFEPPGVGVLAVGRELSDDYLRRLAEGAGMAIQLVPAGAGADEGPDAETIITVLPGLDGEDADVVVSQRPTEWSKTSVRAFWSLAGYFLATLALGLVLLLGVVDRALVAPLLALRRAIRSFRAGESFPDLDFAERSDELGQVTAEFGSLVRDLHSSERRYEVSEDKRFALLSGISDTILLVDTDQKISEVKPGEVSLFGPRGESVSGKRLDSVLPKWVAQRVLELIADPLSETDRTIEFALSHKEITFVEARIAPSPGGKAIVLLRDITERRRAEADRERLTAILDATPDFVVSAGIDGTPRYINPSGRAILGLLPDQDISHLNLSQLAGTDDRSRISREAIPAAMRDGEWSGEATIAAAGGTDVPVSQVLLAHRSNGGAISFLSTIARDITDRKRFESQLVHLADHDTLTQLVGRKRFREELERELARARRHGVRGALLFIDVDQFKHLNDTHGHQAGDQFLAGLADVFRDKVRDSDVAARLGGDEFAILISFVDRRGALVMANGLLDAIREHRILVDGESLGLTASIGLALFPEHGQSAEDLLAAADLAMYHSKRKGRDQITCFEPNTTAGPVHESRLVSDRQIRSALETDRFILYAEPIWDLSTGHVDSFELLVRMIDDQGDILPPASFLGTAERFGLMRTIDRWVVRRAIDHLASGVVSSRNARFSVNLSASAFSDPELIAIIKDELAANGVSADRLAFEVTETAALADTSQARAFVEELTAIGCGFALDDFGVGFSSLSHLKHLPVGQIKIDGSFIRDLSRNPVDQHLVKAIVEVATALGKKTVAEYVADEETIVLLRTYGVHFGQGYLLGRPGPVEETVARRCATRLALHSADDEVVESI